MAQHIPADIINLIMEFLDQNNVLLFTLVCKNWHECIELRHVKFCSESMIKQWQKSERWFNSCKSSSYTIVCPFASWNICSTIQSIPFENLKIVKLFGQEQDVSDRLGENLRFGKAFDNIEEWHLEGQNIKSITFLEGKEEKVRVLNLNDNSINSLDLKHFTELEELHLRCNRCNQVLISQQISECKSRLTCLDLSNNSLDLELIKPIAENELLNNSLRKLNLSESEFSIPVMKLLGRFKNLTHLTLKWMNYINGPTNTDNLSNNIVEFINCFAKLQSLDFGYKRAQAFNMLKAISKSPSMKNLTHLNLTTSEVKEEDVLALCTSSHVKKLKFLDLSCNRLGFEAINSIANSQNMINLTYLDVSVNLFGYEGRKAIADSLVLNNLKQLFIIEQTFAGFDIAKYYKRNGKILGYSMYY